MISRHTGLVLLLLLLPSAGALGQDSPLAAYIREGLAQNLGLQEATYGLAAARRQAREARGGYLPSLSFEARYSRAGGGRNFEIPVGDLLNPAYDALNTLLPEPAFPHLDNQAIPFLRTREQDTRLRLVQPLFRPSLPPAVRREERLADARRAGVEAARRRLVADIKTGYFTYLKADRVVDIMDAALALVRVNLRVNERLLAHGKVTGDAVYRARAEVSEVEQQLAEARMQRDLAGAAFNVLLNRPLDAPITPMPVEALLPEADAPTLQAVAAVSRVDPPREALTERALAGREELQGLAAAAEAAQAGIRMARSAYLPDVSFVFDYGIQGTGYRFSGDAPFRQASLVMRWNLFNGMRDRERVERARLEHRALETRRADAARHIRLEVRQAYERYAVARATVRTAEDRLRSARQTFRLVRRRYEEGMAPQVTFLDARTTLTRAESNLAVTRFDLLIRAAELERAAALYPL